MVLFNDGDLRAAYDKFDRGCGLVNVKTKAGGFNTLQKAITLDSLGYGEQAQKLYKSCQVRARPRGGEALVSLSAQIGGPWWTIVLGCSLALLTTPTPTPAL